MKTEELENRFISLEDKYGANIYHHLPVELSTG